MVLKLFEYVYVQHLFCKLHNNYFWAKLVVGICWTLGWIRINGGLPWFKTRFYDSLFWYMSIHCWTEVLGLSGMELILFLVCMVVWFGFLTGTVWITHQYFGSCWAMLAQHQEFCSSQSATQWVSQGWARSWEGMQPAQLTQTDQSDMRYCIMSCSAIKAWGVGVI